MDIQMCSSIVMFKVGGSMLKTILMVLLAVVCSGATADDWVQDPDYPAPKKPVQTAPKSFTIMAEKSVEECWLENMPGTKNDFGARQKLIECSKYAPYSGEKSGGWFGGKTVSWCIKKYEEDTVSPLAARLIFVACNKLYKNE